ncbi:35310_t:CDS:2, partial [Gigaspora margarita]
YGTEKIQDKLVQESFSREITKERILNLQQKRNTIPIEEMKDIQKTSNQVRIESTISSLSANQTNKQKKQEPGIKTPEIVASTLYFQSSKIEKKESNLKQNKLSSTRNLDQSNTVLIDFTTKNYKGKENQKTPAIQDDNLAELGIIMYNILSRLDNLKFGTKENKYKQDEPALLF